jgi:hypothetical protein
MLGFKRGYNESRLSSLLFGLIFSNQQTDFIYYKSTSNIPFHLTVSVSIELKQNAWLTNTAKHLAKICEVNFQKLLIFFL